MSKSYLDVVKECDNFPYYTDNPTLYNACLQNYYAFKVSGCSQILGYVPKYIIHAFDFSQRPGWDVRHETRELTLGHPPNQDTQSDNPNTKESLTSLMSNTLTHLSKIPHHPEFTSLQKSWRNESFPIYDTTGGTLLLTIDRCASALFGILTTGVQLTCYVNDANGLGLRIWIGRRSRSKQTYPGLLDNTAAGGLETGMAPLEGVVREAVEEAALDEGVVRGGVRGVGALSYWHVMPPAPISSQSGSSPEVEKVGMLQPEIEYIYELELDSATVPRPGDSEVEEFYLMSVDEVSIALRNGEFKLNSAIVLIDFFIRHGIVTAENEPGYFDIVTRLHRRLAFPTGVSA
ncbi:NUDIX hydrolase domain-like protein [Aspergillus californicus]